MMVIVISAGLSITPSFAQIKSAGMVKIEPAARDSPAEPIVWTMLLSRMESLRMMILITVIEITAAGMDADTVSPTLRPRYAFAAPKTTARTMPSMTDAGVISVVTLSAGIYGLKLLSMSASGGVIVIIYHMETIISEHIRPQAPINGTFL